MIDRKRYGIVVFSTSQAAAQAEIKMQAVGFECRLISLPEQINAGCGLVLQFSLFDKKEIKDSLQKEKITISGIYEVTLTKSRQKTVHLLDEKEE